MCLHALHWVSTCFQAWREEQRGLIVECMHCVPVECQLELVAKGPCATMIHPHRNGNEGVPICTPHKHPFARERACDQYVRVSSIPKMDKHMFGMSKGRPKAARFGGGMVSIEMKETWNNAPSFFFFWLQADM